MSWRIAFVDIIENLKTDLTNLTDTAGNRVFDVVYVGRKVPPKDFPCAFILPDRIRGEPSTSNRSLYRMPIRIRVISTQPSSLAGLKDAIDRLGYVKDMLTSDRHFHDLVDNLEITDIIPEVAAPLARVRHEAELTVTFEKWVTWR